jgi:hypothetical protein
VFILLAVHHDLARAGLDPDAGDRVLPLAGGIGRGPASRTGSRGAPQVFLGDGFDAGDGVEVFERC